MITIRKNKQPGSLIKFRKNGGSSFDALDRETKNDIINSLLSEQGFLCAYCMRRIPRDEINPNTGGVLQDKMRIEHVKEQVNNEDLRLDYGNMVAVCPGYLGGEMHCDRSKGSTPISLSPFDERLEASISYSSNDGSISSSNAVWNKELTDKNVLNLNQGSLRASRKMVIKGLIDHLNKRKWTKSQLLKELDAWSSRNSAGEYREYLGVVRYYLSRKLKTVK